MLMKFILAGPPQPGPSFPPVDANGQPLPPYNGPYGYHGGPPGAWGPPPPHGYPPHYQRFPMPGPRPPMVKNIQKNKRNRSGSIYYHGSVMGVYGQGFEKLKL